MVRPRTRCRIRRISSDVPHSERQGSTRTKGIRREGKINIRGKGGIQQEEQATIRDLGREIGRKGLRLYVFSFYTDSWDPRTWAEETEWAVGSTF